jgi:hypothetical protein
VDRLAVLGDFVRLVIQGGRWWLAPILVVLGVVIVLVVIAQTSVIAPFLYPLF